MRDLARTEDQETLAEVVSALLQRRSDSAAARAAAASEAGYDEDLWRQLCEQVGVAALPIPEEYDGAGASLVESGVVLEEIGRNLTPSPLLATTIATAALLLVGGARTGSLLRRVATGEVATVDLDGSVEALVLDASAAALHLRVREGALELLEDPHVDAVGCLDQTMRLGRVRGGSSTSLGAVDAEVLGDLAAALVSAVQVGTAQHGLDLTVAYSRERVQFGRPIGSFQALKHRMADMLVRVEASRSVSWGALAAGAAYLRAPGPERARQLHRTAAAARSYCTESLQHVAAETVQLHGGVAITWEHDAQLVLKRAQSIAAILAPPHLARAGLV